MPRKPKVRFAEQALEIRELARSALGEHQLCEVHEEEDVWGLRLVFQNECAGLQVDYSPPAHGGWACLVAQLQDGVFPKHPINIDEKTPLYRFDIRDLAAERIDRVPELQHVLNGRLPIGSAADLVQLVVRCGDDVLRGDFTVFETLRERVRARIREFRNAKAPRAEA